jgi:hypothetical protein
MERGARGKELSVVTEGDQWNGATPDPCFSSLHFKNPGGLPAEVTLLCLCGKGFSRDSQKPGVRGCGEGKRKTPYTTSRQIYRV